MVKKISPLEEERIVTTSCPYNCGGRYKAENTGFFQRSLITLNSLRGPTPEDIHVIKELRGGPLGPKGV
jgi:hypothetical protein